MEKVINRAWIETALDNMGQDPEEALTLDYSGRGMYGEKCFGFILDTPAQIAMLAVEICRQAMFEATATEHVMPAWDGKQAVVEAEINGDTLMDIVTNLFDAARNDSMGHGVIVYFPGWTLAED